MLKVSIYLMASQFWYFKIPLQYVRSVVANDTFDFLKSLFISTGQILRIDIQGHNEFYYGYIRTRQRLSLSYLSKKLPDCFTFYIGDIRRHRFDFYRIIFEKTFTRY